MRSRQRLPDRAGDVPCDFTVSPQHRANVVAPPNGRLFSFFLFNRGCRFYVLQPWLLCCAFSFIPWLFLSTPSRRNLYVILFLLFRGCCFELRPALICTIYFFFYSAVISSNSVPLMPRRHILCPERQRMQSALWSVKAVRSGGKFFRCYVSFNRNSSKLI